MKYAINIHLTTLDVTYSPNEHNWLEKTKNSGNVSLRFLAVHFTETYRYCSIFTVFTVKITAVFIDLETLVWISQRGSHIVGHITLKPGLYSLYLIAKMLSALLDLKRARKCVSRMTQRSNPALLWTRTITLSYMAFLKKFKSNPNKAMASAFNQINDFQMLSVSGQ